MGARRPGASKLVLFLIGLVSVVFTGAAFWVFTNANVELEPTRVLNPTNFDKPEQLGAVLYRRFWSEVRKAPMVVLGSSPLVRHYDSVWKGFVITGSNDKFDRFYQGSHLRSIHPFPNKEIDFVTINEQLGRGEKILIHTVATELELRSFRESFPEALVLFQSLYPATDKNKNLLTPMCDKKDNSRSMACLALASLFGGKRKKFDVEKYGAVVESPFKNVHLVYIFEPY